MKKNIAVLLLAVMFSWTSVDAASLCSYDKQKEITKDASNVKVTYEEAQGELDKELYFPADGEEDSEDYVSYYDYFKIKIINITEDIYIKLENSVNDETLIIEYKDTDEGAFTMDWEDLDKVTTISYTVYSSSNTDCAGEVYRNGVITLPKLNSNYKNAMCYEIPEFELCKKYITTSVSDKKFRELAEGYIQKQQKDETDKKEKEKEEKGKKSIILIVSTSIIIVVGGVAIVIARKKRGSRVI